MIGVKGQSVLVFTIGDYKDFLTTEDFKGLTLIEEAGNMLPTFECSFSTRDPKLLRYLNEGNKFNISLGKDVIELTTSQFEILSKTIDKSGGNSYDITIKGILSPINYLSDHTTKIYAQSTSVDVLAEIAKVSGFMFDSNVTSTQDRMNWIQYGIANKAFVNEVMIHSYLGNKSFLGVGISLGKHLLVRDLQRSIGEEPKWIFVSGTPKAAKEIEYQIVAPPTMDSGFMNLWAGYTAQVPEFNLDTGAFTNTQVNSRVMLAQAKTLDRSKDVQMRSSQFNVKNSNMHPYFWQARRQNLMNLALYSACKLELSYHNVYVPQRVYDIGMLLEKEINAKESEETYSGKYIISKLARNYTANALLTTVTLNREAFSGMLGELQ